MSKFIEELKKEHSEITAIFDAARALGVGTKEGQRKLLSVKVLLFSHLRKEDGILYPALDKAAQSNNNLRANLETFAKDAGEVTTNAENFFNKYSEGSKGIEFAMELGKLSGLLSIRMQREEKIFFTEYDKLNP